MATPKIAVVIADFYKHISAMQLDAIKHYCNDHSIAYDVYNVPGALEIPPLIAMLHHKYDVFVALGCVIRGETTHYDIVCNDTSRALMELNIYKNLCIGNGVLTVENEEQALARADKSRMNKAAGALEAALTLYHYKQQIN